MTMDPDAEGTWPSRLALYGMPTPAGGLGRSASLHVGPDALCVDGDGSILRLSTV